MDSPTVLCIDDLPQALERRKAILESHGYCVKIASSGPTAIRMLAKTPVAAVLLEYKQEGLDAEAVACHIKQRFPNLPIILLSAYAEMPQRILWLVDEYVMTGMAGADHQTGHQGREGRTTFQFTGPRQRISGVIPVAGW
jgi:CheY-like chemotaxis protein